MKRNVVEQINYALVAKTHTPMYLMHKYWARKPHNVVAEYIKHYTKERDIVLDPFSGSGVTAIEAIKLGRKAVAIDLNPISAFMTRCTVMPIDSKKFEEVFEEIEKNVKDKLNELYETKCPKCKGKAFLTQAVWAKDKNEDKETSLKKIWYYCPSCNKKGERKIENLDLKKIEEIDGRKIKEWYPTTRFYYNGNPFIKKEKSESVDNLFTKRNLIALAILLDEIEKISDNKIQQLIKFAFTSSLEQASKLNSIDMREGREWMTRGWTIHSFWVPIGYLERNVWDCFEERCKKIRRGKRESNQLIQDCKEAKKFSDLVDGSNIFIKTHNALELTDIISKNSVDYVFTDPPYGGAVQYFELSTLWASWMKMCLDYNDEITINKNQNKDFEYYHKMLRASFKEIYQVLKPGKYMTVTFHSTDIKVWNSIIKAVVMVGFELEKIIYQPPAMPSAKGQLQPYGSAVGDYYIRFRKPEKEVLETEKEIDLKTYELEVVDAAQRIIGERGEPTIYQHILNGIMADLQGGRRVPVGAKNIDEVLDEHVGKEFELLPIKNEEGKIVGRKWWLKGADIAHFSEPTLSDRVERKIVEVLEHNVKVSFDEILQAIFIEFPNALTPEAEKIKDILKEYAIMSESKWRLKPELISNLTESAHNKMIYMTALLGKKAGYDVWIGKNEQSQSYNKTKLDSLVSIKKPVWRFVSTMNWDRVNQIDVIWHEQGRIVFEFEVENTTAITEAISRGSNIPLNKIKRVIVIPKERETMLYRKIKDPMINENITKQNWQFIFYQDLENFFNRKNINMSDFEKPRGACSITEGFEKLFKCPKEAREKQNSLNFYLL